MQRQGIGFPHFGDAVFVIPNEKTWRNGKSMCLRDKNREDQLFICSLLRGGSSKLARANRFLCECNELRRSVHNCTSEHISPPCDDHRPPAITSCFWPSGQMSDVRCHHHSCLYSAPQSTMVGLTSCLTWPEPEPVASSFFTMSKLCESATSPKTTCLPSNQEVTTVVMKN